MEGGQIIIVLPLPYTYLYLWLIYQQFEESQLANPSIVQNVTIDRELKTSILFMRVWNNSILAQLSRDLKIWQIRYILSVFGLNWAPRAPSAPTGIYMGPIWHPGYPIWYSFRPVTYVTPQLTYTDLLWHSGAPFDIPCAKIENKPHCLKKKIYIHDDSLILFGVLSLDQMGRPGRRNVGGNQSQYRHFFFFLFIYLMHDFRIIFFDKSQAVSQESFFVCRWDSSIRLLYVSIRLLYSTIRLL